MDLNAHTVYTSYIRWVRIFCYSSLLTRTSVNNDGWLMDDWKVETEKMYKFNVTFIVVATRAVLIEIHVMHDERSYAPKTIKVEQSVWLIEQERNYFIP